MDRMAFAASLKILGLFPSPEVLERFATFEEAIYRANEVMNMTRVPREACASRHFVDSLLLHLMLSEGASVLDLGTGPGFPAWPLACARPDLMVTALDSSGKMLGFLRSQPLPNLDLVEARAEEWGVRERFDFVTGRAVAPLPIFLELASAPCRVGGAIIPMRTPAEAAGFASAASGFEELSFEGTLERELPGTDIVRAFPIYRKTKRTPKGYPRRWAEIRKNPR